MLTDKDPYPDLGAKSSAHSSPKKGIGLSIIVPVYNSERYLERAIFSLANQTLKNIEIILINDGSTDGSANLINEFAGIYKNITVIHQKNSGVAVARNAGIKQAVGEYIGFMDSDDYVDLDFYENLYTVADKNNADIVKGDIKIIMPDGKISHFGSINSKIRKTKINFFYGFTSAIYKKEFLKQNNIYFPNFKVGEDSVFIIMASILANRFFIYEGNSNYFYDKRLDSLDSMVDMNDDKIIANIDSSKFIIDFINKAHLLPNDYNIIFAKCVDLLGYDLFHKTKSMKMRILIVKSIMDFYNQGRYLYPTHYGYENPWFFAKFFNRKRRASLFAFLSVHKTGGLDYFEYMKGKKETNFLKTIKYIFGIWYRIKYVIYSLLFKVYAL